MYIVFANDSLSGPTRKNDLHAGLIASIIECICQEIVSMGHESVPLIYSSFPSFPEAAERRTETDSTSAFELPDESEHWQDISSLLKKLERGKEPSQYSRMASLIDLDMWDAYFFRWIATRSETDSVDLNAALTDLAEIKAEALEDGYLEPTEEAVRSPNVYCVVLTNV